MRVLIADDDAVTQRLLEGTLEPTRTQRLGED